jgi:thiamine biosynthesis lipoprotein
VLGTSLELQVSAGSTTTAMHASTVALAEIERLEAVFSSYLPDSELCRWQQTLGTPEAVSPELLEVLEAAEHWRARTSGAFNPSSEEWTRLWRRCAADGRAPTATELDTVRARVAGPLWRVDRENGTATRLCDAAVTLNAIAKGYILDRSAACAAALPEVSQVLVNIGGDLRVMGAESLVIGITDPLRDAENVPPITRVRLNNGGVASSGGCRRGLWIAGKWHSHLFDPRTGLPVEAVPGASVVAADAAAADALATAFSVMAPEESLALADALPGVACFLVLQDGQAWRSRAWADIEER